MADSAPSPDEPRVSETLPNVLLVDGDDAWGYTIRRPEVWQARPLDVEGGHGVVFTPDPKALDTMISVEIRDLGVVVWQRDLRDIETGFLNGLRAVPGSTIERHKAYANEFAIGVDAVQTFSDGGVVRKRWIRLLHKKSRQARVIAQGATVAEYERLRPLFAPCLTTFRLHDGV